MWPDDVFTIIFINQFPAGNAAFRRQLKEFAGEFVLQTGYCTVKRFTLKWLAHFGLSGFGGFLFLLVELLLQACELSLGVHRELTVLDPGEVGRLGLIYLPGRVALVLSETDGRLVVLAENQSDRKSVV